LLSRRDHNPLPYRRLVLTAGDLSAVALAKEDVGPALAGSAMSAFPPFTSYLSLLTIAFHATAGSAFIRSVSCPPDLSGSPN
jgi:hypothetical protein